MRGLTPPRGRCDRTPLHCERVPALSRLRFSGGRSGGHSGGQIALLAAAGLCAALALLVWARARRSPAPAHPAAPMQGEPLLMLWAWEAPEDLTALDPHRAGVAFLAREVFLTPAVQVRLRRQPLRVPSGAWLMADVRIEAHLPPGAQLDDSPAARAAVLDAILPALQLPGVRALQIDFDATASQLPFYEHLLADLRAALPAGMPLSITALPSWCGAGGFVQRLRTSARPPIDEAVTMEFRLGGPVANRLLPKALDRVTEPACATAIGVSTDETWPPLSPRQRVYVFRDGPWTPREIDRANRLGVDSLRRH